MLLLKPRGGAPAVEYVHFDGDDYLDGFTIPPGTTQLDIQIQLRYRDHFPAREHVILNDDTGINFTVYATNHFGRFSSVGGMFGNIFGFRNLGGPGESTGDTVLIRVQMDTNPTSALPGGARCIISINGNVIAAPTTNDDISTLGNFKIGNHNHAPSQSLDQDILSITMDSAVGTGPMTTLYDLRGDLAYWNALPYMNGTVVAP